MCTCDSRYVSNATHASLPANGFEFRRSYRTNTCSRMTSWSGSLCSSNITNVFCLSGV